MRWMMRNGRGLWLALAVVALGVSLPTRAEAQSPLAGTSWVLTELNGKPPVPGGVIPTLNFSADGTSVSGNGGCNTFSGAYTATDTSIDIGPLIATRRACVDPLANTQETEYFQALEAATRYAIVDGQLVLYRNNKVVARFVPA